MLGWIKPATRIHKLNVDGSRTKNGDTWRVMKDEAGSWCGGFMVNIRTGEVLQAETWGLFHGLHLAHTQHIMKLEIESDSVVLVNVI